MTNRQLKNQLFEQVARLTKAVASPKRLELIELLAQAPKTVEMLSAEAELSIALTSAHLKALKTANLVTSETEGKHRRYRLINEQVSQLWVLLHQLSTQQFPELARKLNETICIRSNIPDSATLIQLSSDKHIQLIDVRPENEYQQSHLPHAHSMPIEQLSNRLNELDKTKPVVAYCRGPFCLYARDAVQLLIQEGFNASQWTDGIAEFKS
jgi:rhodanese-related sulfurtransferase/DNA-binding transcriptional ArsR family regulator